MFLGLGGSRRRAQGQTDGARGGVQLVQEFGRAGFQGSGAGARDALQALATGKYAPSRGSQERLVSRRKALCEDPVAAYEERLSWSNAFCEDAMGLGGGVGMGRGAGSPRSTLPALNLSRETSRGSGDSGVSGHEEEAMSRDCTLFEVAPRSRQSPTLALAKKLKHTLGSKFADSLRETIMEVAKREKAEISESDAWPGIKPWGDDCWPGKENHGNVVSSLGHGSPLLSFSSVDELTGVDVAARSETALKGSSGGSGEQSKSSSGWLCPENLTPQSAMTELSCSRWGDGGSRGQVISSATASSAMEYGQFFTSGYSSLLLGQIDEGVMGLDAVSNKGEWVDDLPSSQPPITRPAGSRRRFFPEAAAMGTKPRPESILQQASKSSFEETFGRYKDRSLLDMLKGIQGSSKDRHASDHESDLLEDARQSFYGHPAVAAADSNCEDSVHKMNAIEWRGFETTTFSSHGAPLLGGPESGGGVGCGGSGVKRLRDGVLSSGSAQVSKRQCMRSNGVLLDGPQATDAGSGVRSSEAGFKDILTNLTARESAYEVPCSSLADLLQDLSQDSLLPQA